MTSSLVSFDKIRFMLSTVDSYVLPKKYSEQGLCENDESRKTERANILIDSDTHTRYNKARQLYLQARMTDLFLEYLGTFDSKTGLFQYPPFHNSKEQEKLSIMRDKILANLQNSVLAIKDRYLVMNQKYRYFCLKREEVTRFLKDIENMSNDNKGADKVISEEDEECFKLNGSKLTEQEHRLKSLTKKRLDLERKLRKLRQKSFDYNLHIQNTKGLVKESVNERRTDKLNVLDDSSHVTRNESELADHRIQELEKISCYYESMRLLLEDLGGLKIISISSSRTSNDEYNDYNSHKKSEEHNFLYLKVLILDKHLVVITLSEIQGSNFTTSETNDIFRVKDAKLLTPSILTHTLSYGNKNSDKSSKPFTIDIPAIDDLVRICSDIEPVDDLRFIIRETKARIWAITARLDILDQLRSKYLTKIGETSITKYGYGGEDQDVVCSLNSCVTVVIRLTPDFPLLKGSAYLKKIVGVGGWNELILQKIKSAVNKMKFRSPVDIMDKLVEEIEKFKDYIPKTPTLTKKISKI